MSHWSNGALVAKHLRTRPGASVVVAVLMLLLSMVAVLAPLALTTVSDAAMRDRLSGLSTLTRDVIASDHGTPQVGIETPGPGELMKPWDEFLGQLAVIRQEQPDELRALLGEPMALTRFAYEEIPDFPRTAYLSRMMAPQMEEHVTIVAGRAPDAPPPGLFDRDFEADAEAHGAQTATEPIDIMLSAGSAAELDVTVGDILPTVQLNPFTVVPYRVSGIFEALDPDDDFWDHARAVLEPSILSGENGPVPTAIVVLNPGALSVFGRLAQGESQTEAWYPLDVEGVTAQNATAVLAQLRAFGAVTREVGEPFLYRFGVRELRFTSEAVPALETAIAEARATIAVVAMIVAGPIGVAVAVLLLGCRMLVAQHRSALRLLSSRGARPSQLRLLLVLQGLVVGLIPVVLGTLIAVAASSFLLGGVAAISWPVFVLPAVMAVLPAALLGLGGYRALAAQGRADMDAAATPAARRLRALLEVATAGLAVVATGLLLSRGLDAGEGTLAFDPLLAAAPLLLALVACIVALRLYPLALRALLRRFRRAPGFVGFLGAARALREPAAGLAPALALIVGLSVAVSSGVLLSTLQQGVRTSVQMQVGADIKLEALRFTNEQLAAISATEGVRATATIAEERALELQADGKRRAVLTYIVDVDALSEVQPAQYRLIPEGTSLAPSGTRLPALVSPDAERVWAGSTEITAGERAIDPVAVIDSATPLGARSNWMLIDVRAAEQLFDPLPPVRTVLVAAAPGVSVSALADRLADALDGNEFDTRVHVSTAESMAAVASGGPAATGLRAALLLSIAFVALLSAVAVAMTLVLGTRARERLLALLPSLGATRRSGGALAAWEIWPAAASAVLVGSIFGALLPLLVLAAVDLRPFTASPVQPAYVADPLVLGAAIGGFLVLTAALTFAALAVSRRARAASVLRTVEDA